MLYYDLWDKTSSINGVEASHFLENPIFKEYDGDIILIYKSEKKLTVTQVEKRTTLCQIADVALDTELDALMTAYEKAITAKVEETTTEAK